jgi:isopentenyl diphosphate isomerase/L-lactate dehydrogenase-like FMN-dependent dehydrogenase
MKRVPTVEIEPVADLFCQELTCIDHMGGAVRLTFTVTRNYGAEPVREIVSRLIVPAEQLPRIALQLVGVPERELDSHSPLAN